MIIDKTDDKTSSPCSSDLEFNDLGRRRCRARGGRDERLVNLFDSKGGRLVHSKELEARRMEVEQ